MSASISWIIWKARDTCPELLSLGGILEGFIKGSLRSADGGDRIDDPSPGRPPLSKFYPDTFVFLEERLRGHLHVFEDQFPGGRPRTRCS